MQTILDLQELDKQVSRRRKRLPFLHLFLFRNLSTSPLCPSICLPPAPSVPEPRAALWKVPVEALALLGKLVSKGEAAAYSRHSWPRP